MFKTVAHAYLAVNFGGLSWRITSTVRYYGKSYADEIPPFSTGTEKEVRTVNGAFSVEAANAVGVTLLFEKEGFKPMGMHFATYEEHGAPVIHKNLHVILRNANASTHQAAGS